MYFSLVETVMKTQVQQQIFTDMLTCGLWLCNEIIDLLTAPFFSSNRILGLSNSHAFASLFIEHFFIMNFLVTN